MLLSSTYAVQLRNNQRQLTSVHGPIAPVTFDNAGCRDVYDHGHSMTAPASPCKGPAALPAEAEAPKVAAATAAAKGAADTKVAASAAKDVADAKEATKPKEAGAGAKKAKSEAEGTEPEAPPKAAKKEAKAPAKAGLLLLDTEFPENLIETI